MSYVLQLLACKTLKTRELFKFSKLKLKLQCTPTAMLASLTAALLQMLMQLEGRAILWTSFKMGLRGQKGPCLNAQVCYQSPHPFSASPTCQESGSTLPACHTKSWGKDSACHGRGHNPPLDKAGKKIIQEVCGIFLFLARGVDGGLLPVLSALASQQANPTEQTLALCKQFLDYMAPQDKAVLTYKTSDMVLAIHSDASY